MSNDPPADRPVWSKKPIQRAFEEILDAIQHTRNAIERLADVDEMTARLSPEEDPGNVRSVMHQDIEALGEQLVHVTTLLRVIQLSCLGFSEQARMLLLDDEEATP